MIVQNRFIRLEVEVKRLACGDVVHMQDGLGRRDSDKAEPALGGAGEATLARAIGVLAEHLDATRDEERPDRPLADGRLWQGFGCLVEPWSQLGDDFRGHSSVAEASAYLHALSRI